MEGNMDCDNCGKEMSGEDGSSTIGMVIQIYPFLEKARDDFMAKQLGKYAGKTRFKFCYECLIDAMMGVK